MQNQSLPKTNVSAKTNSFNYIPAFHLGRVAGAAALGGLEVPHGFQQFQIVLMVPYQDRTEKSWICNTPPDSHHCH